MVNFAVASCMYTITAMNIFTLYVVSTGKLYCVVLYDQHCSYAVISHYSKVLYSASIIKMLFYSYVCLLAYLVS